MIIQTFPSGPYATNAYVVACEKTKVAVIVDPSPGSFEALSAFIKQNHLVPEKILLTHSHWDHIADVAKCKRAYAIPVWVHALDKQNMEIPGSDRLSGSQGIEGVPVEHLVNDGERFFVGEIEFTTIFTPGHTPGGVCYYAPQAQVLLSGDTLFRGSIGRVDLPTGEAALMWPSLQKLAALPKDTLVYPGHGPSTTIGRESWLANAEQHFG